MRENKQGGKNNRGNKTWKGKIKKGGVITWKRKKEKETFGKGRKEKGKKRKR